MNVYVGIMALVFFTAGIMVAKRYHELQPTASQVVHYAKSSKIKRPEGDPWTCFGAGRYEAMAEGKVCPGWEDY